MRQLKWVVLVTALVLSLSAYASVKVLNLEIGKATPEDVLKVIKGSGEIRDTEVQNKIVLSNKAKQKQLQQSTHHLLAHGSFKRLILVSNPTIELKNVKLMMFGFNQENHLSYVMLRFDANFYLFEDDATLS